ncbi:MAG: hypothetical protein GKR95_11440 [Gammaproteobacteria bacterium]|nr:hypothetical protein [Gammaproteobacteria bacterium]
MLTEIRDRATGWIAWVIVLLITIPFALWGVQSYFEGVNEIPIATVNDSEISIYEYQDALSRQRQSLAQRLGRGLDPALLDSLGIKEQVVNSLVNERLIQSYTQENNYRLSDQQLSKMITTNPAFLEDDQFSEELYLQLLSVNNFSPQSFEATQRQQGVIGQLQTGVAGSGFLNEQEFEYLLSLESQKRKSEYVLIPGEKFSSEFEVSDSEVAEFYETNIDDYQTEERLKVNYVELSIDSLAETVVTTESELMVTYEQISDRFRQAESRRASHILFSVAESAGDEEKANVKAAAELVLQQATGDKDFGELAALYSDDTGSGSNGGDLGVIAPGQMVKPFEDAVFSMEAGDVRGLIESRFGFHIIKLTELHEERQQTFEEVKELVIKEAKKQQAENLFAEISELFQNLVFEDPENLTTVADELDLAILSSEWFTQEEGEGIASDSQIRRVAFSEDVINEGLVSPAIEVGFDKLFAVQKAEHEPASPIPLEEVKVDIIKELQDQRSREKVKQMGEELVERITVTSASIDDWRGFLSDQQLESLTMAEVRTDISPELLNVGDAIFSHPAPGEGVVGIGGVVLFDGDYAIYMVEDVDLGSVDDISEEHKARLRQRLMDRDGGSYYRQFSEFLRANAEVTIAEDQL